MRMKVPDQIRLEEMVEGIRIGGSHRGFQEWIRGSGGGGYAYSSSSGSDSIAWIAYCSSFRLEARIDSPDIKVVLPIVESIL